jgi:hypothetical protein
MKMIVLIFLSILFIFLAIIFVFGTYRTIVVQTSPNQQLFTRGKVPSKFPDGVYKGTVRGLKTSWIGKSFESKNSSGINNFKTSGKVTQNYTFKTYVGKGVQDNKDVFKIDYNIPSNPFWLRFILDEIVEVKPNTYLGKVHIVIFPGLAFSMGYFSLEK